MYKNRNHASRYIPDIKIVEHDSPDGLSKRKKSTTHKSLQKTYDIRLADSAENSEEEEKANQSMLQKMKLQQMEMPEGKYSRKVFGLPKIKSNNSKAERAVLIKTSEKRKGTNNEYFNTSPYGRVANLI